VYWKNEALHTRPYSDDQPRTVSIHGFLRHYILHNTHAFLLLFPVVTSSQTLPFLSNAAFPLLANPGNSHHHSNQIMLTSFPQSHAVRTKRTIPSSTPPSSMDFST